MAKASLLPQSWLATLKTNLLSILHLSCCSFPAFVDRKEQFSVSLLFLNSGFECILCYNIIVVNSHPLFSPFFIDEYQHILQAAGQLLAPLGLNFLKFSLSLRYYSPRVELFNKVSYDKLKEYGMTLIGVHLKLNYSETST